MKTIKITVYLWTLLVLLFTACADPMDEITNVDYPRAFSPIVKVTSSTFSANVEWAVIDDATTYILELSEGDSLAFNNVILSVDDLEALSYSLTGLLDEHQYSVRIKSKAFNESQEDSKWYGVAFKTNREEILSLGKIKKASAEVKFPANTEVTSLKIKPAIEGVTEIALPPDAIATGSYLIEGLTPGTKYSVEIYRDTKCRGGVSFTTNAMPVGDQYLFLNPGDDLRAAIESVDNDTTIIFLMEGAYTVSSSITISKPIVVLGDPDADNLVKIEMGTNRIILADAAVMDTIMFTNLEIFGVDNPESNEKYFINQGASAENCNVSALIFDNCYIHGYGRSVVRVQNIATRIDNIVFNNCIIEKTGVQTGQNYSVVQITVASTNKTAIRFSNSTVFNSGNSGTQGLVNVNAGAASSILLENCTFDDVSGGAATANFINCGTAPDAPVITIKNCIMGKTANATPGINVKAETAIVLTGSYKTSDFNMTSALFNPLIAYAKESTDLWTDPANGDFTFKDTSFAGKANAGDPRWRQ
jgi:hypothetical protein